jgi:hypothetical protein
MTTTAELTIWIAVNETGDVTYSIDSADDALQEMTGSNTSEAVKVYDVTLKLPVPAITKVEAAIPDTGGPVTVTVT